MRTNLQANIVADKAIDSNNMASSFMNITKRHGWRQLWGGLGPTLLRDVPFSITYWGGYEYTKPLLKSYYFGEGLNFYKILKFSNLINFVPPLKR